LIAGETFNPTFWLALGVLALPLVSFIICFLISEKFAWLSPMVSSLLMVGAAVAATILFSRLNHQEVWSISRTWFVIANKPVQAGLWLDSYSLLMILVVCWISFLVHIYSIGYMAGDVALTRYFGMLGFFTFAMLGLVMSSNLLITFCFWELVSFSSYRLIGHWQNKPAAVNAASKAFLVNKAGDIGFLIGLMILWSTTGIEISGYMHSPAASPWLAAAGVCVFIGVMGKSAQFPLLHWLPDAMEGPTPVSALIHAATMVAAGVFLLVRISGLFTPEVLTVIAIIGAITALAGAIGALVYYDIKKILAYSTISQLGFMILGIGGGAMPGGFLHLLHHAFFKAGLFLAAGAIIHALHQYHHQDSSVDVQDIRNMGGLRKNVPFTFIAFLICGAALAGFPFTAGFVSKESILTQMHIWAASGFTGRWWLVACAWLVTFLTPFYTFRLIWFIFLRKPKNEIALNEAPGIMRLPMGMLAIGSLALLVSFNPFHISSFFNKMLNSYLISNQNISLASVGVVFISIWLAYYYYRSRATAELPLLFSPSFYLDWLTQHLVALTQRASRITTWFDENVMDRLLHAFTYLNVMMAHAVGWADRLVVDGLVDFTASSARGAGTVIRAAVNGKIQSYLLWAMAGLLIFILWILY
jgi:NADH-quinone oxidoreductase subunit L